MTNPQRIPHPSTPQIIRTKGPILRLAPAGSKDFIIGKLQQDGIDVRVDWNGSSASLGTFEVRTGGVSENDNDAEDWQSCPNITTGQMNDLVSPDIETSSSTFWVRLQRGPDHGDVPFQAKAIPVAWKENRQPAAVESSTYIALRDLDYAYQNGVTEPDVPWQSSTLDAGCQRLPLPLQTHRVYELWVRLQDPNDPERWHEQDPIIRTDHGGSHG